MSIRYKILTKYGRKSMFARGMYSLKYKKGDIVQALPDTLGIMVYKSRWQAARFMDSRGYEESIFIIIRVKTFSRGVVPKKISSRVSGKYITMFYDKIFQLQYKMPPPMGTICYDKVEVID